MSASIQELDALFKNVFVSPELYLRSFDITADSMTFTPMTAETYRSTSFLDHRMVSAHPMNANVKLSAFVDTFSRLGLAPRPIGFIFHTAFCCSTLLARCLQEMRSTLVLKEPLPLRTLSEHWFDDIDGPAHRNMRDVLAALLSRRFRNEAVVIKATSYCNNIMAELMDMHESTRGVFIYSDLEESISSFLGAPGRRAEARKFLTIMKNLLPGDISIEDCQALIDAQTAALLWMLQVRRYCELVTNRLRGRLVALNCRRFLDDPIKSLIYVAEHLGITDSGAVAEKAVASSTFTFHAKIPQRAFDKEDRRADIERKQERYGNEIDYSVKWARGLPIWNGIPERLPEEYP